MQMENKSTIDNIPKYILNAPKMKFKKPTIEPTPFILTESIYFSEHSDSDTEEEFSQDNEVKETDRTEKIKTNSLLIKYNIAIQN